MFEDTLVTRKGEIFVTGHHKNSIVSNCRSIVSKTIINSLFDADLMIILEPNNDLSISKLYNYSRIKEGFRMLKTQQCKNLLNDK